MKPDDINVGEVLALVDRGGALDKRLGGLDTTVTNLWNRATAVANGYNGLRGTSTSGEDGRGTGPIVLAEKTTADGTRFYLIGRVRTKGEIGGRTGKAETTVRFGLAFDSMPRGFTPEPHWKAEFEEASSGRQLYCVYTGMESTGSAEFRNSANAEGIDKAEEYLASMVESLTVLETAMDDPSLNPPSPNRSQAN